MNSKINLNREHEDQEISAQFYSNLNQNQRQQILKNDGQHGIGYQLSNNIAQESSNHLYNNTQTNHQVNKTNNSISNNTQNNITKNMNIEPTINITNHSAEHFSPQKMPSISVNERQASPNRYYHQNNPSSTQTIITFGSLENGIINRNNSLVFPTINHNSSSSRIIYEKQLQPLAHLPQYLRNRQLKQEVTVLPTHISQRQQYMRNPSPQHTSRIVPKITFNIVNTGNNSNIPTERNPPNNGYIIPQQMHEIQRNYPQPQSQSKPVNIIRKQNINEITVIYTQFHVVTQQIQFMLNGEIDQSKKQKIRYLMQIQMQLEQKLKKLLNRLQLSQKQNIQLKTHIKTVQNKLQQVQTHQTRPTSEITTQQDTRIYQLTQYISQLQQTNKNISTQYKQIQQKIKILQDELIRINKQPIAPISINVSPIEVTQNNSVNNSQKLQNKQSNQQYTNQLQQKYQQILQSKQDYINQLQSQNLKIKTQLSNLKKQANKQRNAVTINGDQSSLVNSLEFYKNYQGSTQKLGNIIIKKQEEIIHLTKQQEQYEDIIQDKDEKIRELFGQITSMKQNQLDQQKTLQKATRLSQQMQQLKQELKIRKQQLSHNIQAQNKNTQQLHNKIQQLLKQNEYLEEKISQLQDKVKNVSSQSPTLTIYQKINMQQFQKQLKKKQVENIKLRDTIESNFKSIMGLENFISDFQNKFKDLEEQVNEERRLTTEKQNRIREFQAKQAQYQKKQDIIKQREQQINDLKKQVSELNIKLITRKQQITKTQEIKVKQLQVIKPKQPTISQNLQQFRQNYSKSKTKIFELETQLKTKQNKITNLQNQLKQKQDNKIIVGFKKQIQLLKIKIKQNQQLTQNNISINTNTILNTNTRMNMNPNNTNTNPNPNTNTNHNHNTNTNTHQVDHVFQQKVIYQLQNQIQVLKSKLNAQQVQQGMYQGYGRTHSKKVLKNEQKSLLGIQRRLIQFDNKLSQIIQSNQDLQLQGNNYCNNIKSTQTNRKNLQVFTLFERQKKALFKRHYEQIKYLQDTISDLQSYCSSLQNYNAMMTMNTFTVNQAKVEEKNIYTDQIGFFRQKNKELEGRVQFLMEVCKNLKQKLENASKPTHDSNVQYYKQQVNSLQTQISQLNKALKKLTQSKATIVKQLQKLQKDTSSIQTINQLQKQIKQLRNQNIRLQQNNKMLQTDIKKYLHQTMEVSKEMLGYKTGFMQKQNQLVQVGYDIDRLSRRNKQYQQNISNLHNQNNILKSQMNRLHEYYQSKKKQADIISQNIASRNFQLRQTISSLQLEVKIKNSLIEQYQQKLKSQNTNLATSFLKYQSPNSTPFNSRLRELEAKMGQFQHTADNLSKQNYELKLILQDKDKIIYQLNKLTQHHPSKNPDLDYYIQLIRSVLINIQNLLSELNSQLNERSFTIIERVKQEIKIGLQSCSRTVLKK